MGNYRYYWVDNTKIIATALVVIGHLYIGLTLSGILPAGAFYSCFIPALYTFHVPLFFICSGFLYQRLTKEQSFKSYSKNILKKLIAFGVPYFVFSSITYLLKFVFSSNVNTENEASYFETLFVSPSAPYWFLYALFFIFLITPTIKNKVDAIIRGVVAIGLYFVCSLGLCEGLPGALEFICTYICLYLIWFVIGMLFAYNNLEQYKSYKFVVFLIAFIAYFFVTQNTISFVGLELILGLFATIGIIFPLCKCYNKKTIKITNSLSKFTLPVFLMHTIFCAGARSVLLKFGITNAPIHILVGLIASFLLPILASIIMEKIRLDFLYNPTKYIKIK